MHNINIFNFFLQFRLVIVLKTIFLFVLNFFFVKNNCFIYYIYLYNMSS